MCPSVCTLIATFRHRFLPKLHRSNNPKSENPFLLLAQSWGYYLSPILPLQMPILGQKVLKIQVQISLYVPRIAKFLAPYIKSDRGT